MERETYLGDAVYASFDGYQIWLRTGDGNDQRIALEPSVFAALVAYAHKLRGPNMNNLEHVVEEAVTELRERLAAANLGSDFRLDIEASGRIQGGTVKVSYVLSGTMYGSDSTRGNRLAPVVDEFLRRHGWNSANAPLEIGYIRPAPGAEPETVDEVPF